MGNGQDNRVQYEQYNYTSIFLNSKILQQ